MSSNLSPPVTLGMAPLAIPPRRRRLTATAGIAAVVVGCLVGVGTRPPGPGLYGDDFGYLGAAESLARFGTLRVPNAPYSSPDSTSPLAQWPPGFPLVVAAPIAGGLSAIQAGRVVVILSAAISAALIVLIVGGASTPAWGLLAVLVVGSTTSVAGTHLEILSEPPFIALTLLTLGLMVWDPDHPVGAGVVAAIAVLVRYVGLGLSAGVAAWTALRPGTLAARARRVLIAIIPGAVVYLAWSAHVRSSGETVRTLHLEHDPVGAIRRFASATFAWLAPDEFRGSSLLKVALFALLIVLAVRVVQSRKQNNITAEPARRVAGAALLLAFGLSTLLVTARLLESSVAFYDRMLSPVHLLLDVAIVSGLAAWSMTRTSVTARALAATAVCAWFAASGTASWHVVREARTAGLEHAGPNVRLSPLWHWVRDSAPPGALYTNDPADVYFVTRRPSRSVPWVATDDSLRALCDAMRRRPGYLVWFNRYRANGLVYDELLPYTTTPERLERTLPLRAVARFSDGEVWTINPSTSGTTACGSPQS
jgi:hypothetical protein